MFYYLKGNAEVIDMSTLVVDCSGVGYLVYASSSAIGKASIANGEITIYTYVSVREDAFEIYGFADKAELDMFKLLISVSGIGPKAGLAILSTLSPSRLAAAIMSGDSKAISASPGIGAKTAARVILELKDKIAKQTEFSSADTESELPVTESTREKQKDVADTLLALGYNRSEISGVLKKVDAQKSLEDMIKDALKYLMK